MGSITNQQDLQRAMLDTLMMADIDADEIMTVVCDIFVRSVMGYYPDVPVERMFPVMVKALESYFSHPECMAHLIQLKGLLDNNQLDC